MAHSTFSERISIEEIRPYLHYVFVPVGLYVTLKLVRYFVPGPHCQRSLCLKDKTVLITGASQGLGRALAFEFYRQGAKLILTARSEDLLKQLVDELVTSGPGHKPEWRLLDVANPKGMEDLPKLALDGKTIDVLVNNAGVTLRGSALKTTLEVQRQIFEVNYFGAVAVSRALYNCIPDSGAIVITSSVQGRIAVPYRSAYAASKHALQGFFDAWRAESRPQLQILMVNVTYMNTGFGFRALDSSGKQLGKVDEDMKKGYSPEYCARKVVQALKARQSELFLMPFTQRVAIFLRWFYPDLLFWILYRRSRNEPFSLEYKKITRR